MVVYKLFFLRFSYLFFLFIKYIKIISFQTPRTSDKPLKASTNAKVQIYLWLGIEEYESFIYKHLPAGFDMPVLPLHPDTKTIRYDS